MKLIFENSNQQLLQMMSSANLFCLKATNIMGGL